MHPSNTTKDVTMDTLRSLRDPLVITIDLRKIGHFIRRFLEGMLVGLLIFSPVLLYGLGWIRG